MEVQPRAHSPEPSPHFTSHLQLLPQEALRVCLREGASGSTTKLPPRPTPALTAKVWLPFRPGKKMDMGKRFVHGFKAGSDHFAGTPGVLVTQSMI